MNHLQDKINNYIVPKTQYATDLASINMKKNNTEEYISPQNGELTLTYTDYVLPGRNGLDLEIKRIYKSSMAKVFDVRTEYINEKWVDRRINYLENACEDKAIGPFFYDERYNLGIGMRFSFPSIEIRKNKDGTKYKFLHTESGDVYRIIKANNGEYTLENHLIKDVKLIEYKGYDNGQGKLMTTWIYPKINLGISQYAMIEKCGKTTYFSEDGRILGIKDRYGNILNFEYSEEFDYHIVNNLCKTKLLISKITDSIGREIKIEYKEKITHLEKGINGSFLENLDEKSQVIIHLPNNKKIIYNKRGVLVNLQRDEKKRTINKMKKAFIPNDPRINFEDPEFNWYFDKGYLFRKKLDKVYDTDGELKYEYKWEQSKLGFTFTNGNTYKLKNEYCNLVQVDYSKTNKVVRYDYKTYTKKLGDKGSMQYSKVVAKQDLARTGWKNGKYTYDIKNKISYKYTNEPSGFGHGGYKKDDQAYLKDTYRYYTECIHRGGVSTKYTYNGLHDLMRIEEKGKDHKKTIVTTYDKNRLPQKRKNCLYQLKNGQTVGSPIVKNENYVYDDYGNLTSYTGPEAKRNANGNPINEENTIKYTYALDKYHVLTSKTWKKDKNTICKIKYQVDHKGNIIKEEKQHKENGQNKPIVITYKYDQYGNMVQKNIDGKYIRNYEYGVDANGINHKGAYLTKEYSLLKEYTLFYGKEISKKYTYDFNTGNIMSIIDENENKTKYEYDELNRLTIVHYPNGSEKKYIYNTFDIEDRSVKYIFPRDRIFINNIESCITCLEHIYYYDIFDNLVLTEKPMLGQFLGSSMNLTEKIEYDSNGNKTKEIDANGHSTRYEYDSANRLIKKSFWENDHTQKKYMRLSYTLNGKSNTPLIVTTTDEEGYKKKSYYDIQDRLVKEEETPDKTKYYTTTYAYDYVGNKIRETDPKNNTTTYTYDDSSRLIKKRDAMGYEEKYYYDACNNLIQKKNAKNISIYYEYNKVGRLIREKAPAANGGLAITRYVYDLAGNKIKEVSPKHYDPRKDTSNLAHTGMGLYYTDTMTGLDYMYDTMNRLEVISSTEGNSIEYRSYDQRGNLKKVVDGLRYNGDIDQSTGMRHYYDYLNRVIYSKDAKGNHTFYKYDLMNNLLEKKDARNHKTKFEYNADGTLAKTIFSDGGFIEYTYDKLGRKLTEKDQRGNITSYTYNGFGQVTSVKDPYNNIIQYDYDANGNLIREIDKRGNETTYVYDKNDRLIEKKVALENNNGTIIYAIQKYFYDQLGNIIKTIKTGTKDTASKRETNYTYYNNNLVDTITDNSGRYAKNIYDKNGNLTETKILRSTGVYDICKFEYDNRDRQIKSIKLVDEKDIYNAADLPNIANIRDSKYKGKVQLITEYEYDILGNKIAVVHPRAFAYLNTDRNNRSKYTIRYSYDELNRLEKTIWECKRLEVHQQYYYDKVGNIIKERNENGNITVYTYDSMNRLKTIKDSLGNTMMYSYDVAGNKITETNALNHTITYTYDKLNRLEKTVDPYSVVVSKKVYDENGNIKKIIDARGYLSGSTDSARYGIEYEYDLANRLVKVENPEIYNGRKSIEKYEYDQYSEKIKEIDGLGNITRYEYDNAGRLVAVIDALNVCTRYSYDQAGSKLTMTTGKGQITEYSYGNHGLLIKVRNADNHHVTYQYDLELNLMKMIDKNGNQTLHTYDSRNLLLTKCVPKAQDYISYDYDAVGNRIYMRDNTGESTYVYDPNDRLIFIRKENITKINYHYDKIGNVVSVTDKKGFETTYTYDKSSRMKTTSYNILDVTKTTTYDYDENGNRKRITYQGGVEEEYTYDKNNKLTTIINKKANGNIISSYSYTYDVVGRKKTKTDHYGTTKYFYNEIGQIQKIQEPEKTSIYEYDKAGNRQLLTETYTADQTFNEITGNEIKYRVKRSSYIYSNTNMLLKLVENMNNVSGVEVVQKIIFYTYDKNGNQLTERSEYIQPNKDQEKPIFKLSVHGEGITAPIDPLIQLVKNEYDGFNRLKKIESIKAGKRTIITYDYDGDDLRTKKIVKDSTNGYVPKETNYLYDRQHVILETDKNHSVIARYIRGINYIARIGSKSQHSYYLYNGHGDAVQTVSETGDIENEYNYDIFGKVTLAKEKYSNPIRYAGEFFDEEAGLYYLRARYYNPYVGRFISEDSYWGEDTNPLSLNLYTYCENNPIMYIDPTGHWSGSVADAGGWDAFERHIAEDCGHSSSSGSSNKKSSSSSSRSSSNSSRSSHSGRRHHSHSNKNEYSNRDLYEAVHMHQNDFDIVSYVKEKHHSSNSHHSNHGISVKEAGGWDSFERMIAKDTGYYGVSVKDVGGWDNFDRMIAKDTGYYGVSVKDVGGWDNFNEMVERDCRNHLANSAKPRKIEKVHEEINRVEGQGYTNSSHTDKQKPKYTESMHRRVRKSYKGEGTANNNNLKQSIVKNSVIGATDGILVNTVIENLDEVAKDVVNAPKIGIASRLRRVKVKPGIKGLKGVTRAAGVLAVASYGYDVYQDVKKYDDTDAAKAVTVTTAGTGIVIASGLIASGVGAPAGIVVGVGILASVVVGEISSRVKERWINNK